MIDADANASLKGAVAFSVDRYMAKDSAAKRLVVILKNAIDRFNAGEKASADDFTEAW